jgi:DNA-binding NarL/FixJ family response regulator
MRRQDSGELCCAGARQKHGEEHTEFATAMSWLAYIHRAQRHYAEAEPLYKRSIAILERLAAGESCRSIARTFDVHHGTIARLAR